MIIILAQILMNICRDFTKFYRNYEPSRFKIWYLHVFAILREKRFLAEITSTTSRKYMTRKIFVTSTSTGFLHSPGQAHRARLKLVQRVALPLPHEAMGAKKRAATEAAVEKKPKVTVPEQLDQ